MTQQEQQAKVREIANGVHQVVKWRNYLSWDCRLILSEAVRDAADAIDYGVCDRAKRKMVPTLKRLRPAGTDNLGRQLYRMTS